MASLVLPAITNLFFAVGLFLFIESVRVPEYSQIYEAAVQRFVATPWSSKPPRNIYGVKGPKEVYEWLRFVFAPQLYAEAPVKGDSHDFCSEAFQCTLGEGHAVSDAQCLDGLVSGRDGCPSFFDDTLSCCEPCTGPDCKNMTLSTMSYDLVNTTAVTDLSKNCEEELPPWLENLAMWNRDGVTTATASSIPSFIFCPERASTVGTSIDSFEKVKVERPLMVARYNRVMMGRLTLKRMNIVNHESFAFRAGYSKQFMSSSLFFSMRNLRSENTTGLGDCDACEYMQNGGYRNAGGYVQYLEFDKGEDYLLRTLADLKTRGWFDMSQGTLTLDVLIYNGNVNKFLHVSFAFVHGAGGETSVLVFAFPLDLSLHDESSSQTYMRFFVYLVLTTLFVFFLRDEIADMTSDPAEYFSNFLKIISLSALFMFLVSGFVYCQLVLNHVYITFQFPLPPAALSQELRVSHFDSLVSLSDQQEVFFIMLSILWMLVIVRVIVIGTSLIPDMTIVFNTLSRVSADLAALFALVITFWGGFCISFHYMFGIRSRKFSSFSLVFVTTLRMIMGQTMYPDLQKGDPVFASTFFMLFHVWFLILQQTLLSVVIVGYDAEKLALKHAGDYKDTHPVFKLFQNVKDFLKGHLSIVTRLISIVDQLFGSSDAGSGRINADEIAKLRDRRATRPRLRQVRYEPKHEVRIENDMRLVPERPAYPHGLMHYYVDHMEPEGQADSHNVQKRFRLIAFKGADPEFDYEHFRHPEVFDNEYRGSTKLMLAEIGKALHVEGQYGGLASVELLFEGDSKKVTFNCVTFFLFWAVFLFWVLLVCRVDSSYNLASVKLGAIQTPTWFEYQTGGQQRVVDFPSLTTMASVPPWMKNAMLPREYQCYGSTSRPSELCEFLSAGMVRSQWSLYAKSLEITSPLYSTFPDSISLGSSFSEIPEAASGFSLAYVPRADVYVTEAVRFADYNIGVHYNSHVRMTLQIPCFMRNPRERWAEGFPYVLNEKASGRNCLMESCMRDSILEAEETGECFGRFGQARSSPREFNGHWSKVTYSFSDQGSYKGLGGIVLGLGSTRSEADIILRALEEDNMFSEAIAVAFETTTYNGNYEMFTYTAVKFAVLDTGLLKKDVFTSVYPVKIFAQGQMAGASDTATRTAVFTLFFFVVLYLLYFVYHEFVDIYVQYRISSNMYHHWYQIPLDFFTEDVWNIVELSSLCLSTAVMVQLFIYQAYKPTFQISNPPWFVKSWTTSNYRLDGQAGLDLPADSFDDHRYIGESWRLLVGMMGVTAVSLGVHSLKYMNFAHSLRLAVLTFGATYAELVSMTIIIFLMLFGFMVMFYLRFGVQFARFGTMAGSVRQLFAWICQQYMVDDVVEFASIYFVLVFPVFSLLFFVLTNMFLAAVVHEWRQTRRDARDPSVINEISRLYDAVFPKGGEDEDDPMNAPTKMDGEYWQQCGILQLLSRLQEDGSIDVRHLDGSGSVKRASNGTPRSRNVDSDALDQKRIAKIFKRVHMEIASHLCRNVYLEEEVVNEGDRGAGVGGLDLPDLAQAPDMEHDMGFFDQGGTLRKAGRGEAEPEVVLDDEAALEANHLGIPILDHEVEDSIKTEVAGNLLKCLNQNRNADAQEFLLDALITAMEKTDTFESLQHFFMSPPIIEPRKPQEKKKFSEAKLMMEVRLNHVLKWLEWEAKIKHYTLLKEQTLARERVLKQQSLVLADYLQSLEDSVEDLRKDIEELETKTTNLRKHVMPLL